VEGTHLIIREEEFRKMQSLLKRILIEARAKVVFLVDKNGQLLCSAGDEEGFDTTALGSLAAGNIAASGGLARLIGEKEFSILFHQGEHDNMHISLIADRVILVVVFDVSTPVGLVRLKVSRASGEIQALIRQMEERMKSATEESLFEEITDEDIDKLFK